MNLIGYFWRLTSLNSFFPKLHGIFEEAAIDI